MAVRLRLAMHGTRHSKVFHMVAIDREARRNAKPIETLAVYDPRVKLGEPQKTVQWSVDRIRYWLANGAEPTTSVVKLLTMVSRLCQYHLPPTLTLYCTGWHTQAWWTHSQIHSGEGLMDGPAS